MACPVSALTSSSFLGVHFSHYVELTKAVYGLIQAARRWYDTFSNAIIDLGYEKNPYDECFISNYDKKSHRSYLAAVSDSRAV